MKKSEQEIAPEQYELNESPQYSFGLNRRAFFGVLGSGLAVAFSTSRSLATTLTAPGPPEDQLSAWIHVGENGGVTIYTGKAEVGQNIRTSLAQIVAEELSVPMESITMIMGDTALTPYDRGTFGSRSIPFMGPQLRKAAATTREVLLDMAASNLKVSRDSLYADAGSIRTKDGKRSVGFGTLTKGKTLLHPIRDDAPVKSVEQWKIAGTSVPKVNGAAFVTGRHKFTSDIKLPEMQYGRVLRAPAYGSTMTLVDLSQAKAMEGVTVVHDGDFIGVAAPARFIANKALESIRVKWKFEPQPSRDTIFTYLKDKSEGPGSAGGSLNGAYEKATYKIEKTVYVDYIAHAPLEPRAGLASWEGNKLTVWTGTQRPFGVQEELAEVFSLPKENIRVIQPDTGSGYGGKHTGEAGIEAARLSKACGKPVKVVWTREEEFTWAYFRPAGVIDIRASMSADGTLTTWEFHNYNSGGSGIETPYDVKNKHIKFHGSESPLRQGSYRGLAAPANVFAREAVMDDLADAVKMDPLAFRMKNLSEPRMKAVLEAAADKFGWKTFKPSRGTGSGIACGTEKASFVATCAEVGVDDEGSPIVRRIVIAFECGAIINPEHLKNQVVGSVIQGLGGALFEKIEFREGKILNAAFSKYRVPRFSDIPEIEVVLLNRKDIDPAGAGETPIIAVAPAIRNAIARATGQRLYSLPLNA